MVHYPLTPQAGFDPARSIAMLFTDVVDSSGIKRHPSLGKTSQERDRAYLDTIQTPHFVLIRECLRAHGGEEVSTMGDSFFATFRDGEAALRCAFLIQQRMHAQPIATPNGPLRVRVGIHSGSPQYVNGTWQGTDVDTGARIEAVGTGGQIVVSAAVHHAVGRLIEFRFHRLGTFVVRGSAPMELWEADWDGTGPRRTTVLPVRAQRTRDLARAGGAVLLIAAVLFGGYSAWLLSSNLGLPAFGVERKRPTVAVMGFVNLSGKPEVAWLSTALAETLNAELAAGKKLRVQPGTNVAQTKMDLALADSSSYSAQTLKRIRDNLDADEVVLGAYLDLGGGSGQVRFDLRAQDTSTGETLYSVSQTGSEAGIAELVSRGAAELRHHLGAAPTNDGGSPSVRAALPSGSDATRLYADGLAKLHRFDAAGASELLRRAVATDPQFPFAHVALSRALSNSGDPEHAVKEAKAALDLSSSVSAEDRLWIEGEYHAAAKEWNQAVVSYQKLFHLDPQNMEHGLRLASLQIAAGQAPDALATIKGLSKQHNSTKDGARLDLAEADAYQSLAAYGSARKAADRAAAKGKSLDSRFVQASASQAQGQADFQLVDYKSAAAHFEAAKGLYQDLGDLPSVARLTAMLAKIPK